MLFSAAISLILVPAPYLIVEDGHRLASRARARVGRSEPALAPAS